MSTTGEPRIALADLRLTEADVAAVTEVLESGWLTMGPRTRAFEDAFAAYVGTEHAVAVSNGTAALHLACLAAGLGPGDEVICPSLTFVASANAIAYTGAEPVFCDVESLAEPLLSPERAAELVGERTRGLMLVHLAGYACQQDAFARLADDHGLVVIEDAAHAAGSRHDGVHCGTWGDAGCFSFFSNKNLSTGEGGMLVTNDPELADRVRLLRSHGMTSGSFDRHRQGAGGYDVVASGFNYRIDEPRAALGESRLKRLDAENDRRRELVRLYREELAGVEVPFAGRDPEGWSHHILPVLVEAGARDAVRERLAEDGIQTSVHYPPAHRFRVFEGALAGDLPLTEEYARRTITLPLHPHLEDDEVREVAGALARALA